MGEAGWIQHIHGPQLRCAQGSLRLSKSAFHADFSNLELSPKPPSLPHMQTAPEGAVSVCSRGGEGGIRTHGGIATTAVFKTAALNRSATSPWPRILAERAWFDLRDAGSTTRLAARG
jgi:hypothetical protein